MATIYRSVADDAIKVARAYAAADRYDTAGRVVADAIADLLTTSVGPGVENAERVHEVARLAAAWATVRDEAGR